MERCTGKITDWLIKCGAIPETDRELYEYAIYSILLSLSPMLLALAIGALFGSAVQGGLTITPFVILRKFSGGYHAKSARVCFISSSLLLVLCIFLSSVIKCDIKLLVATILSAISLAYFSPLENENRLLSREEQKRYKKVVIKLLICFGLVELCLLCLGMTEWLVCISIGMMLTAFLQGLCIVKNLKTKLCCMD